MNSEIQKEEKQKEIIRKEEWKKQRRKQGIKT